MKSKANSSPAFLLKIAPLAFLLTGGIVVYSLFVGVTPSLPALVFNCLLGTVSLFLGYQHFQRQNDPWLSSLLSVLNMTIFIGGVFVARESLYHSSDVIVAVQIIAMVWFVFFGLLLGLKGYLQRSHRE